MQSSIKKAIASAAGLCNPPANSQPEFSRPLLVHGLTYGRRVEDAPTNEDVPE